MDITTAAAQLENGIRDAFTTEKLGCHIVKIVRGPHTLTAVLRLYDPDVKSLRLVNRMGPTIAARAGVRAVRVQSEAGFVYVEAPSPETIIVDGSTMQGQGVVVPVGLSPLRVPVGVDFGKDYHMLFVAPTGGGKTTSMRVVAHHLARQNTPKQARFIVSTFKPKDWRGLAGLAHCGGMITDVGETVQMVEWLAGMMYKRGQAMTTTPHIFCFLDDLINLLERAPELAPTLAEIASLGGGSGVHLVIGTQRLGNKGTGSSVVAGNITARLVFRTVSAQDAALFTGRGDTGAERLGDQPGDGLLITTTGGVQRIAVGLVTDEDLARLPAGGDSRPWLGGTATGTNAGIPPVEGKNIRSEGDRTGILPLPDREPTPAEMMALAALYNRKGSKNKTLAAAYGGKTPKRLGWLNQALETMGVHV